MLEGLEQSPFWKPLLSVSESAGCCCAKSDSDLSKHGCIAEQGNRSAGRLKYAFAAKYTGIPMEKIAIMLLLGPQVTQVCISRSSDQQNNLLQKVLKAKSR